MAEKNTKTSKKNASSIHSKLMSWFNLFERWMITASHYPRLCIVFIGISVFAISAVFSAKAPPVPYVHDEFAYLLGADTFASGRLTNPPHEHWKHFETFHVVHQPTYQSKYPPASAVFMAAGQKLTGYPIVGVWLSAALAAAAICWMLMSWAPPRWAVYGGLLVILHPGLTVIWTQMFWGGSVAVLGGALALGGIRRLIDKWLIRDGVILGLGLTILAHSRPYEGLILTIPLIALFLVTFLIKAMKGEIRRIIKPLLMLGIVGGMGLASVGFYNWKVTGDFSNFPHTHWTESSFRSGEGDINPRIEQYTGSDIKDLAPRIDRIIWFFLGFWFSLPFLLQRLRFDKKYLRYFLIFSLFGIIMWMLSTGSRVHFLELIAALLTVQVVQTLWLTRDKWMLYAVGTSVFLVLLSLANSRAWPHYLAPASPILFYLLIQASRLLYRRINFGFPWGRAIVILIPVIMAAHMVVDIVNYPDKRPSGWSRPFYPAAPAWAIARSNILIDFSRDSEKHLIFVRYPPGYSTHNEWVYNEADIDASTIVWAHDLGPEKNKQLISYYKERNIERNAWLLEPGGPQISLKPYSLFTDNQ